MLTPSPMLGTQIRMMVFPLIPSDVKQELPNSTEIEFVHPHNLGKFTFTVQKSPAGFNVTVKPAGESIRPRLKWCLHGWNQSVSNLEPPPASNGFARSPDDRDRELVRVDAAKCNSRSVRSPRYRRSRSNCRRYRIVRTGRVRPSKSISANDPQFQTVFSDTSTYEPPGRRDDFGFDPNVYGATTEPVPYAPVESAAPYTAPETLPIRSMTAARAIVRENNLMATARMDALFRQMAELGASDLHLSVSMPPMIRKDGKMQPLPSSEPELTEDVDARTSAFDNAPRRTRKNLSGETTPILRTRSRASRVFAATFYGPQGHGRRFSHHSRQDDDRRTTWTFEGDP